MQGFCVCVSLLDFSPLYFTALRTIAFPPPNAVSAPVSDASALVLGAFPNDDSLQYKPGVFKNE